MRSSINDARRNPPQADVHCQFVERIAGRVAGFGACVFAHAHKILHTLDRSPACPAWSGSAESCLVEAYRCPGVVEKKTAKTMAKGCLLT